MNYDLDFRYRRALQPDGLRTIQHATTAVADAITDARNAGVNPDNDPAIVLLARHLGRLAQGLDPETLHDEDTFLRRQCLNRIAELKAKPALLAIARRGVDYDPQSKTAFHNEAKRALRALANHLGLAPDSYNLRSNKAGPAVSGEVTLHTETLYVQVSLARFSAGREVMFRRCESRQDYTGHRNNYCDIAVILDPPKFEQLLRRETGVTFQPAKARLI